MAKVIAGMLQEEIRTTGAAVMGRLAYDLAEGDLTGYEFQVPIFVLTHEVPAKAAKGQNDKLSITFITDGIRSAVHKAQAAAGDKHVLVIGGPDTFQQCLNAGLVDETRSASCRSCWGKVCACSSVWPGPWNWKKSASSSPRREPIFESAS